MAWCFAAILTYIMLPEGKRLKSASVRHMLLICPLETDIIINLFTKVQTNQY